MEVTRARPTAASPDTSRPSLNRLSDMLRAATDGLPQLDERGFLPAGLHRAGWDDMAERFGGTHRRDALLRRLQLGVGELGRAGIHDVIVGGSFVSGKERPGDVDLAWLPSATRLDARARHELAARVQRVAPDIDAYAAHVVVGGAEELGRAPGSNFAEFFSAGRDGTARGAVLLSTTVPGRPAPAIDRGFVQALRGIQALVG